MAAFGGLQSGSGTGSVTTLRTTALAVSGTDLTLIVGAWEDTSDDYTTSFVWDPDDNATPMTGSFTTVPLSVGSYLDSEMEWLDDPIAATAPVEVTYTFAVPDAIVFAAFFTESGPIVAADYNSQISAGTPTSITTTVSNVVSGDMVIDFLAAAGFSPVPTLTPDASQTGRLDAAQGAYTRCGVSTQPGSTDGVMSWTMSNVTYGAILIAVRIPDSGGGALTASGTPAIEEITASGISRLAPIAIGTPSIDEILANGISTILKASSGNPSIPEIGASGVSTVIGATPVLTSIGSPSLATITANGLSNVFGGSEGFPAIETIVASGVSTIIKKGSGAVTLSELTASGISSLVVTGILPASGNPSIQEIIASGVVTQRQQLSGNPSIERLVASGVSVRLGAAKIASGTVSMDEISASGVSALNVIPPTPDATPTTNYVGRIALDLARPGDIEDPAVDRAILFLHDAVEKLSQDVATALSELEDIKTVNPLEEDQVLHYDQTLEGWRNKLVNQLHRLYGQDASGVNQHIDIDTTDPLVTGSVLTYVTTADGGNDKFIPVPFFVARGYGGIQQTGTPALSDLGAGFQVVPANAGLIATPAGVTQDQANNGLILDNGGVWSVNVIISLSHNVNIAPRAFEVQLYNDTDAVEIETIPVLVAQSQPDTFISLNFMVEIPVSAEGDLLQIRIGNGSTVTTVVLEAYQFSVNRISQFTG